MIITRVFAADGGMQIVGKYGSRGAIGGFLLNSILLITRFDVDHGLSFHVGRCKDLNESIQAMRDVTME